MNRSPTDRAGKSRERSSVPELPPNAIHVWSVHLPRVLNQLEALHGLLSEEERLKAARFRREADRQSSIAARGALRTLISGYTGIPAAALRFQYSENGKPFLAPPTPSAPPPSGRQGVGDSVSFNLSHSGDWVLLAFGRDCRLGVDIERIRPEMDVAAIASRHFTPEENRLVKEAEDSAALFFRLWARKEAYVKACGSALFRELDSFAVPMSGIQNGWFFRGLDVDPQYAAAVVADKAPEKVLSFGFV